MLPPRGHEYPDQRIRVLAFPSSLADLFPQPRGLIEAAWPPTQVVYLGIYLKELKCQTIVVEHHYVDRDFAEDVALFYSRSLKGYPSYCARLHFFRESFDEQRWCEMIASASAGRHVEVNQFLQQAYLGFSVVRPLPGCPVGRTVVPTFGRDAGDGRWRDFSAVREYHTQLAGFDLRVSGLAFQQQDRGVSACATTALWSALQRVTRIEELGAMTPAAITQAASRYFLGDRRSLPSEGLTIHQICEAVRASGLAPIVVPGVSPENDRATLLGYLGSGFPVVLAIRPVDDGERHALCGVGLKLEAPKPPTDAAVRFRDAGTGVLAVYVHDDRLGPYARAELGSYTTKSGNVTTVRTALSLQWPDKRVEVGVWLLDAVIVPAPVKLRLTLARMRILGLAMAQAAARMLPAAGPIVLNCRYQQLTEYKRRAFTFGLSAAGVQGLLTTTVLSRFLGVIEIAGAPGPLFDLLLDTTETEPNPSVLACVRREAFPADSAELDYLSRKLGTRSFA